MNLRPYQHEAINKIRASFNAKKKRVILCAPTGAGKTVIFSYMVATAALNKKRVLIVTDRIELLTQSGGALNKYGLNPTVITANSKPNLNAQVFIGMVETINRRLSKPEYVNWLNGLDLIIFDEAHKQAFNKLFEYISPKTYVIGATATPHRDGNQTSLSDFYEDLIEVIDIPDLIAQGFLARPRSFGLNIDLSKVKTLAGDYDANSMAQEYERQEVYKGVVKNYRRICDGKKALAFCPNISASKTLLSEFVRNGYDCRHLDSEMSTTDRNEVLQWYHDTPNAILCNVGILTTGFDAPETECVILYRATKSKPLFLQMCGRGARVTETKKEFFILDFGNNINRICFWEDTQEWSLEKKKKTKEAAAPVKECPECGHLLHTTVMLCPECGHVFKSKEKEAKEVELEELKRVIVGMDKKTMVKTLPFDKLALLVKAGTLKTSFVIYNRCTAYFRALEFTRMLGYKDGWLWHQYYKQGNFSHLTTT